MKSQLEIAIDLAMRWHGNQRYGKLPYFKHLMDVDEWVQARNTGKSPEVLSKLRAVAFLHDILEDTAILPEELQAAGVIDAVRQAVYNLTKQDGIDYERYMTYILQDELAREVKICDTMANLTQSVKKNNAKRIAKYTRQLAILVKGEYFE